MRLIVNCLQSLVSFTPDRGGGICYCPRSFVCLFVCEKDYSKTPAWIWMKCCVSTNVGTRTNWLTFEPDPDYSPDAGTGLLYPISYAMQRGILLRREYPTYRYWYIYVQVAAATRGFEMALFTASRENNFVGGTCAPPSAVLVYYVSARTDLQAGLSVLNLSIRSSATKLVNTIFGSCRCSRDSCHKGELYTSVSLTFNKVAAISASVVNVFHFCYMAWRLVHWGKLI